MILNRTKKINQFGQMEMQRRLKIKMIQKHLNHHWQNNWKIRKSLKMKDLREMNL